MLGYAVGLAADDARNGRAVTCNIRLLTWYEGLDLLRVALKLLAVRHVSLLLAHMYPKVVLCPRRDYMYDG